MHANMFTKIMATIIVINADNEVHMLQAAIINCKAQYRLERKIVQVAIHRVSTLITTK